MFHPPGVLAYSQGNDEDKIGAQQFEIAYAGGQSVDGRNGYYHEHIGHLTYGHLFCTVFYDTEYSEQTQGESDLELYATHQVNEQENAYSDD